MYKDFPALRTKTTEAVNHAATPAPDWVLTLKNAIAALVADQFKTLAAQIVAQIALLVYKSYMRIYVDEVMKFMFGYYLILMLYK